MIGFSSSPHQCILAAVFILTGGLSCCCLGFVPPVAPSCRCVVPTTPRDALLLTRSFLVPIRNFSNEFTFLSKSDDYRGGCIDSEGNFYDDDDNNNIYQLGLAEERDLPDTSRFIVQMFGADAIRLSHQDINAFERFLMKPAVELVNGYSGIVAFAEVLAGVRSRLAGRMATKMNIAPPALPGPSRQDKINQSVGQALVLIVAKPHQGSDWHIDVIATIELRLQPCDAKIPFSLPWLDRIERKLASWIGIESKSSRDLQPYLSNLAVGEAYRGKGLGRALVRCVEDIASSRWGYSKMYLHVAEDNPSALQLYKSEGYRDVGLRWKPFWAGSASEIGYYVKKIGQRQDKEPDTENNVHEIVKETEA